ncbi:nucleotide cyclase [Lucifera butyrica]|uniref:Nucleotide cyclase n=1 Tax=Lucifera butyrica TaxID=1351585 RepID=A0A498RDC0_9FIRM|nr:diguanylate cyclase [Lucifera butyrica]VBB08122.1 nucleotide cyclase [Lucifera butyrica]
MESARQTILIVDDSRLNVQILRDMLADQYEIFCATSGEQALSIATSENVDLILLDVIMPEMDGYEVCTSLKKNPQTRNIPVIFISALSDTEDITKGLDIGAIDYIIRPFNQSIVKARVRNHLELKKYRDLLEKLSLLDGLTGIANRRYFDEAFDKEWRRALRNRDSLSVLMLDIDYFKKYNDYYGHLRGDDCLRQVGQALKNSTIRGGDFVARYGGEEFVAILSSTPAENAFIVAEKMRKDIESLQISHPMSTVSEYVTVSIGAAAIIPEQGMTPAGLLEKADKALYRAKSEGRNRTALG